MKQIIYDEVHEIVLLKQNHKNKKRVTKRKFITKLRHKQTTE